MSASSWSLSDARRRFGALVEAACAGAPQTVTRRGKPTVVVVDAAEYARLKQLEARPFNEHLLAMPTDDGSFERLAVRLRAVEF